MLVSCKLIMESFSCDPCGCNYKSKTKLRKHQERIHDVRSYTCEHCNKVLVGKHTLRNHIATHKETICKKCGLSIPKNSRSSHNCLNRFLKIPSLIMYLNGSWFYFK